VTIHKLRRISWGERLLLVEALFWLGLARLALLNLPFKRLASYLGKPMHETAIDLDPATTEQAERIGWAVLATARRTPWNSTCLVQGIAAKGMLRRRQIPNTLYLGVSLEEIKGFQAHAWLRCGPVVITGGQNMANFTKLTTFADER
jgi:hypothetical protein